VLKVSPDALLEERGGIRCGATRMTWPQILEKYFQMEGCRHHRPRVSPQGGRSDLGARVLGIGRGRREIALDGETGSITLDSLITIGDVGLAIHPAMTEGQDLGRGHHGPRSGLFEELIYDGQQLMNGNMLEYRVPRFSDLAGNIEMKWYKIVMAWDLMAPRAR